MPQLRQAIIYQIQGQLASHPGFVRDDFQLEFDVDGSLVRVTFAAQAKYRFSIREGGQSLIQSLTGPHDSAPGEVDVVASPGKYKRTERIRLASIDEAVAQIREWLDLLREDLRISDPKPEDPNEFIDYLDAEIRAHPEDFEGHFSPSEIDQLSARLEKVEQQLAALLADSPDSEAELKRVRRDIKATQDNLTLHKKGVWYRMTATRLQELARFLEKSHTARAIVTEILKSLLS